MENENIDQIDEEVSSIQEILENIDSSLLDIAESLRILSKRPSLEEDLEDEEETDSEDSDE